MKTCSILAICGLLLGGSVSAQMSEADVARQLAAGRRYIEIEAEAIARAQQECSTTRAVFGYPDPSTAGTKEAVLSLEWTGGCAAGKRDGSGVLSWSVEKDLGQSVRSVSAWKSEGRFVNGERLGMWCTTYNMQVKVKDRLATNVADSGCSVLAGHLKPLTGNYRKQGDGSWRLHAVDGSPTDSTLAAGALEAQSAKVLADAAAGKSDLKVQVTVQSQSLDDLVRGSKIVLAPSAAPVSLKGKRIAIVLSSQTVSEIDRFKRERQALIDASAGLRGEAAEERAKFIQVSNPDRLLVNILKVVQKHAQSAQPVDDLAALKEGGFDYALVVDWKSATRFDLLGKYDSFPRAPTAAAYQNLETRKTLPAFAGDSLGGFLVSRELKAVRQFPANRDFLVKPPPAKWDADLSADRTYLMLLAKFYADAWGNGVFELGTATYALDNGLK